MFDLGLATAVSFYVFPVIVECLLEVGEFAVL